jgi:hypothetical protein
MPPGACDTGPAAWRPGRAKLGYTNVRERFEGREPVRDLMAAAQRHPGLRHPQLHHGGLHRQLGQVADPPFTAGQDGLAGPMPRISCGRRRVTVGRSTLSAPRRRVCMAAWWASRRCRSSRSPTAGRRRPTVGLGATPAVASVRRRWRRRRRGLSLLIAVSERETRNGHNRSAFVD